MSFRFSSQPEPLRVDPGARVQVTLEVANDGDTVERYTPQMLGALRKWCTAEPEYISLFPGTRGEITIHVAPPREWTTKAGPTMLGVRVVPATDPGSSDTLEISVDVQPFVSLEGTLAPTTSRGIWRARHQLWLHYYGNVTTTATVTASDPDARLHFRLKPSQVDLAPGAKERIRVTGYALQKKAPGDRLDVQCHIALSSGERFDVGAVFVPRAIKARWVVLTVVLFAALLLWASFRPSTGLAPARFGAVTELTQPGDCDDATVGKPYSCTVIDNGTPVPVVSVARRDPLPPGLHLDPNGSHQSTIVGEPTGIGGQFKTELIATNDLATKVDPFMVVVREHPYFLGQPKVNLPDFPWRLGQSEQFNIRACGYPVPALRLLKPPPGFRLTHLTALGRRCNSAEIAGDASAADAGSPIKVEAVSQGEAPASIPPIDPDVPGVPPKIVPPPCQRLEVGQRVDDCLLRPSGTPPITVDVTDLPAGLTYTRVPGFPGFISGTPIQAGSYSTIIAASNRFGAAEMRIVFVVASPPPTTTTTTTTTQPPQTTTQPPQTTTTTSPPTSTTTRATTTTTRLPPPTTTTTRATTTTTTTTRLPPPTTTTTRATTTTTRLPPPTTTTTRATTTTTRLPPPTTTTTRATTTTTRLPPPTTTTTRATTTTTTRLPPPAFVQLPSCRTAVVGQPINGCGEVVATGNRPLAIGEKGLPPGLELHDNGNGTASISGAPTSPGTYRVTLRAKNAGSSVSKSFVINVSK